MLIIWSFFCFKTNKFTPNFFFSYINNCLGKVGQEIIENPFFQPKLNIFFLNLELFIKTGNNQGIEFLFRIISVNDCNKFNFFLHNFSKSIKIF